MMTVASKTIAERILRQDRGTDEANTFAMQVNKWLTNEHEVFVIVSCALLFQVFASQNVEDNSHEVVVQDSTTLPPDTIPNTQQPPPTG